MAGSKIPSEQPPESFEIKQREWLSRMFRQARLSDEASDILTGLTALPDKPIEQKVYYFSTTVGSTITHAGAWIYINGTWYPLNDSSATFESDTNSRLDVLEAIALRKNAFINGAFYIAQHADYFWDTTPYQSAQTPEQQMDNFAVYVDHPTTGATVVTELRTYDTPTVAQVGFPLRNSLKLTVDVAAASLSGSNELGFYSGMESLCTRLIVGATAVASFWAKTNKAGKYPVYIKNDNSTWSLVKSATLVGDGAWHRYEVTFDLSDESKFPYVDYLSVPTLQFGIQLAAASGYHATTEGVWENANKVGLSDGVNFLDSTSNYIYLTGFQIEQGSVATPLEKPDPFKEFQLCQRYNLYMMRNTSSSYTRYGDGILRSTSTGDATVRFPVQMMRAPVRILRSANGTFVGFARNTGGTALSTAVMTGYSQYSITEFECTALITVTGTPFSHIGGAFQWLQDYLDNSWLRYHAGPTS